MFVCFPGKKDKEIALIKHELKEAQRKADQEVEMRKKADNDKVEIRKRLEDETNRRTKEQNNHHQVSEKIATLEKEKRDLSDRLKKESEGLEKLKKLNTELSVAKAAAESSLSDLNDKLLALSEDRNLLEREVVKMQTQLQHEQNQRNEAGGHLKDRENRIESLNRDLAAVSDREQRLLRENAEISSKVADLEKTKANLELEVKSVNSKYDQLASTAASNMGGSVKSQLRDVTDDLNNRTTAEQVKNLEAKMADEKAARLRAEASVQDKDRELSMLSVDFRQLQYKLEKVEADHRQESEKARGAMASLERLKEEKSLMQSDYSVQASEITLLKTNEKRLLRDLSDHRERTKSLEEELHKVKAARSVDDLQRKELEDQLEAEQYFSTLYKTQVRELQDEVDEAKERHIELEREREAIVNQLKAVAVKADEEAQHRRVAEEDIAELEKEKMMVELELQELASKHKSAGRNLEMQLAAAKDTESDLLQRIDLLAKDNDELQLKIKSLQDELDSMPEESPIDDKLLEAEAEMEKMKKVLQTEKILKQQAVNKLAEIMNRKDNPLTKKDKKAESKATSAELRKKEKENRRLQQELTTEKENFNQMVAKYQKDLQDLQATLYDESQSRLKLSMELDTKESELETLQIKLSHINIDTASLSSGTGELELEEKSLEGWLQVRPINFPIKKIFDISRIFFQFSGPVQTKYQKTRLEESVRGGLVEKDHLLQFGGDPTERRPHPDTRPQQGVPREVGHSGRRHSRRRQRNPEDLPGPLRRRGRVAEPARRQHDRRQHHVGGLVVGRGLVRNLVGLEPSSRRWPSHSHQRP